MGVRSSALDIGQAADGCRLHAPALSSPSRRNRVVFRMPGMTFGLEAGLSKSFIQRSGVISG